MKKKIIVLSVILILSLIGLAGFSVWKYALDQEEVIEKEYGVSPLTVVIDYEAQKDFPLQVFYLAKKHQFSESESIKQKISAKQTHAEIILPVAEIHGLRLDWGSNTGRILVKNIEVKSDSFENFNNWKKWSYINIDSHKVIDNNVLELKITHGDPYMIYTSSLYLSENTEFKNFLKQQASLEEQTDSIQPTTARVEIRGNLLKGSLPFEVYLENESTPLTPIYNLEKKKGVIIIEKTGTEINLTVKTKKYSSAEIKLTLPPETQDEYIKYSYLTSDDLILIHPQSAQYVSLQKPFITNHALSPHIDSEKITIRFNKILSDKK